MSQGNIFLEELEKAAEELLDMGKHEGPCTNEAQMKILPKVAPCKKHQDAMNQRVARFRNALQNFKLLKSVFGDGI